MQNLSPNSAEKNPQTPSSIKFIFSSFDPPPKFQFVYTETAKPQMGLISLEQASFSIKDSELPREKTKTLKYCDELLDILIKHKDLKDFRERVNPKIATNYFQVIKEPMDFTTLQRRLRTGSIATVGEFKRCLDLVWSNCQTFNPPEHALSKLAKQAEQRINAIWDQVKDPPECNVIEELKTIRDNLKRVDTIFSKMTTIQQREHIPPPQKPLSYVAPPKEAPVKVVEQPPSQMQLNKIKDKLANTPPGEMEEAWKLLMPFLKKDEILEQKSFNLNDLPDATKIELKKIVLN